MDGTMPEVWTLESWDESDPEVSWEPDGPGYDYGSAQSFGNSAQSFGNGYRSPAAYQAEAMVLRTMERLSPTEAEDFWKTIQNIGRQVAPIAAQVLPVAAPLIGTAIGGPLGGMIGGAAGQFAGQLLGGGAGRPRPAPVGAVAGMVPGLAGGILGVPSPLPSGASSATAQLLSLIQNPALLQSLVGQLMGGAGGGTVPVGAQGTPAPFGAFMNAVGVLANQAASEAQTYGGESESVPAYLVSPSGEVADPTIPESRARALLERLQESRTIGRYR